MPQQMEAIKSEMARIDRWGPGAGVKPGSAVFRNVRGDAILDVTAPSIAPDDVVVASAVEVNLVSGLPFIGDARLTVHNVQPYEGGARVWVSCESDSPLNVKVNYLVHLFMEL